MCSLSSLHAWGNSALTWEAHGWFLLVCLIPCRRATLYLAVDQTEPRSSEKDNRGHRNMIEKTTHCDTGSVMDILSLEIKDL